LSAGIPSQFFGSSWSLCKHFRDLCVLGVFAGDYFPQGGKGRKEKQILLSTSTTFGHNEFFETLAAFWYIWFISMTPRCIAKLSPMKQRANLLAGD